MNPNTGEISEIQEDHWEDVSNKFRKGIASFGDMIPLEERQRIMLEPLSPRKRKGWMRNKPCLCGSEKKFKKCCWNKITGDE
jgi:hypothetical protein